MDRGTITAGIRIWRQSNPPSWVVPCVALSVFALAGGIPVTLAAGLYLLRKNQRQMILIPSCS